MLIERPLLQALTQDRSPVLLIDELDRADEPFDAFLLEVLAENQITIPELGTIRAGAPPITLITSNRTREIHDALKRRCLYHWVEFPSVERELQIVRLKAPGAPERLARQVVEFVQRMRTLDLFKAPGVAETIDWTNALVALNAIRLDPASVHDTLGVLLKYQDDIVRMQAQARPCKLLDELRARGACSDLTRPRAVHRREHRPLLARAARRRAAGRAGPRARGHRRGRGSGLDRREDVHAALCGGDARPPRAAGDLRRRLRRLLSRPQAAGAA